MLILGVCNSNDSGACLIKNGKIIVSVNEERFLRKKNIATFPRKSIEYIMKSQKLKPSDIDFIGCGAWNGIDQATTLVRLVEDIIEQIENAPDNSTKEEILQRVRVTALRDDNFKNELQDGLESMHFQKEKLIFCDHHYSHALTAFYPSPFESAYVLTADGRGDFRAASLWKGDRKSGLKLLDMTTELSSPGAMYGFITKYLGFIPDRHEGKVTGLSARGKMSDAYKVLKKGFWFDENSKKIRSQIGSNYRPFVSADWPELKRQLKPFSRDDIAFAAQKLLEETLISFLLKEIRRLPINSVNVCLAGGCMSNVKLNYEISKLKQVKNIYVFPQMGDGGNALGGAINIMLTKTKNRYIDLPNVYLGPDYTDDLVLNELKNQKVKFEKLNKKELIQKTAEYLSEGKLIGWFQGRMEYGPRALGSRSILADASNVNITQILNERLRRSEFMPFAPVTTPEYAAKCFMGWDKDQVSSRFMTVCYKCNSYLKKQCPAVVHVDNTARPQVVFREQNPDYFDLIEAYINKTNKPVLINTSFNLHEEPIINSPAEAVKAIKQGVIDYLVIGSFIVRQDKI